MQAEALIDSMEKVHTGLQLVKRYISGHRYANKHNYSYKLAALTK